MTNYPILTPETLTAEHIRSWDGAAMRYYLAQPGMRQAVDEVINSRRLAAAPPETELIVENPPVETPVVPAVETPVVEAPVVPAVVPEPPKKIVVDYQVKDEDGNNIGRPTHLEAATEEEMRGKIIEAHIQATRAFHRLKKQKVSFKEQPVVQTTQSMSDAEMLAAMADLKSDDPKKALEAQKKITKNAVDAELASERKKTSDLEELRRQEQVSFQFLNAHKDDFNNCQANVNLIKDYFQQNELAWTLDNLEIAYHALESELAPVVRQAASVAPANPAPPVVPTTQAAPQVVQPVVTAPAPASVVANPQPVAPRPGVNGGVIPGQSSGTRPVVKPVGLTVEEIRSWDGPTMRAKMRNPQIREQINQVLAARNSQVRQ